jgi:hypothetical protein
MPMTNAQRMLQITTCPRRTLPVITAREFAPDDTREQPLLSTATLVGEVGEEAREINLELPEPLAHIGHLFRGARRGLALLEA